MKKIAIGAVTALFAVCALAGTAQAADTSTNVKPANYWDHSAPR